MFEVIKKIFKQENNVATFLGSIFLLLWLFGNLQNFPLLWRIFERDGLYSAVRLSFKLLVSLGATLSLSGFIVSILLILLLSLNLVLLIYYWKLSRSVGSTSLGGVFGALLGVLGVGCVSCGSLVIISLLSFFGGASLLSILPFGGLEFGFLGLFILILSNFYLLRKINSPIVCITD